MDGAQKFTLLVVAVIVVCLTIVTGLLLFTLWPYRVYVGASLLLVILLWVVVKVVVDARGKLNEQVLRTMRYRHHEETPLDAHGQAQYLPQGAQANPHRLPVSPSSSSYPSSYAVPAPKQHYPHYE
jgi:hypothetical protein